MANWQGWQWNEMVTIPCDRYRVPNFISFLKIFNTDHTLLRNSKKLDRHHSHINLAWLCNLRSNYSRTFGGFTWLHVV